MNNQNKFSKIFGLIFGGMGLVFSILGITFLCNIESDAEFIVIGNVFAVIGGLFLIIGICSFLFALRKKRKAEILMREGVCYDADIIRIYENLYMHMNYRHPLIVECGYKDNYGNTYLVKSGNIWMNRFVTKESDIRAKVWVNPHNPKDYYVEIYLNSDKDNQNMKFDFDYR